MEQILHQLYNSFRHYSKSLYIPGGAGVLPSTIVTIFVNGGSSIAMLIFRGVCCKICTIMQPLLEVGMKYCIRRTVTTF